jgi:hypothetical protein
VKHISGAPLLASSLTRIGRLDRGKHSGLLNNLSEGKSFITLGPKGVLQKTVNVKSRLDIFWPKIK